MKPLKEFYPFPSFRPGVETALEQIDAAVSSGKRLIILDGKCGTGKSAIAVACSRKWGGGIITATKALQDQYLETPQFDLEYGIKGKSNYTCPFTLGPVNEAPCLNTIKTREKITSFPPDMLAKIGKDANSILSEDVKSFCTTKGKCPYYCKTSSISSAPGAIFNYDLYLNLRMKSKKGMMMLKDFGAFMVFDEAHQMVSKIQEYFSITVSEKNTVKLLGASAARKTLEMYDAWFERLATICAHTIESLKDSEKINAVKGFQTKLDTLLASGITSHNKFFIDDGKDAVLVKPLDIAGMRNRVFGDAQILAMSATIPKNLHSSLGYQEYEVAHVEIPSSFPKKNRPIIFPADLPNLNKDTVLSSSSVNIRMLDSILIHHAKHKGIIHCGSYKFFEQLRGIYNSNPRFLWVERDFSKTRMLRMHAQSPEPTILVSPAMLEGVDLKDDLARFQIVLKVPYPILDAYARAMMDKDPAWYGAQTISSITQSYGRAVRSETDWANFYIVDGAFGILLKRNKALFDSHFLEACHVGTTEKLMSYLKVKNDSTN